MREGPSRGNLAAKTTIQIDSCKAKFFRIGEKSYAGPSCSEARLHARGATGRHPHHWLPARATFAGDPGGPQTRPPYPMHKQHETDRTGDSKLRIGVPFAADGVYSELHWAVSRR